jgi:uncharacterized membrane-anchored protein
MPLFTEHPLRNALNAEVHARPPVPLSMPERISYLAFVHGQDNRALEIDHLSSLASMFAVPVPDEIGEHVLLDLGDFRLKFERHTEFTSYTFFRQLDLPDGALSLADLTGDSTDALQAVPAAWRRDIPGELMVATQIDLLPVARVTTEQVIADYAARGEVFVASRFSDGAGWVFSDFRLHEGFTRYVVLDVSLGHRQAGRAIQRLLEIETYRMMALLALPLAKAVSRRLTDAEQTLDALMARMSQPGDSDAEHAVLSELTALAAAIEHSVASTTFRFGAAQAYFQLVQSRTADLRETRLPSYPTIRGFMERRLAPALNTCATTARRQDDLSARIARASQLLRTRVDIALERQNQQLLAQMNARARLQLRLQETVEGLSVVAITYYGSQLVHYLAKAGKAAGHAVSPELATGIAIPLIAGLVALGLRKMRRRLAREEAGTATP